MSGSCFAFEVRADTKRVRSCPFMSVCVRFGCQRTKRVRFRFFVSIWAQNVSTRVHTCPPECARLRLSLSVLGRRRQDLPNIRGLEHTLCRHPCRSETRRRTMPWLTRTPKRFRSRFRSSHLIDQPHGLWKPSRQASCESESLPHQQETRTDCILVAARMC